MITAVVTSSESPAVFTPITQSPQRPRQENVRGLSSAGTVTRWVEPVTASSTSNRLRVELFSRRAREPNSARMLPFRSAAPSTRDTCV